MCNFEEKWHLKFALLLNLICGSDDLVIYFRFAESKNSVNCYADDGQMSSNWSYWMQNHEHNALDEGLWCCWGTNEMEQW